MFLRALPIENDMISLKPNLTFHLVLLCIAVRFKLHAENLISPIEGASWLKNDSCKDQIPVRELLVCSAAWNQQRSVRCTAWTMPAYLKAVAEGVFAVPAAAIARKDDG